jgi:CHAT domain-containing protein
MSSSQISKQDLLAAWSRASVLYVAAHLERNPEAPLLCYFPMTFRARPNRPEDSYLDLLDARTTDLSGCELAVLSSCASGEPYVVGGRSGPSMADALLDAGAKAVIHTRWRVRDERAAEVAPELAHVWLEAGESPVASWCARRRAGLCVSGEWRHPFDWAAWSATVSLPAQQPSRERSVVIAAATRSARAVPGRRAERQEPSGSPR